MPSHYSSLGFTFASAEELAVFSEDYVDDADAIGTPYGTYLRLRSESGAELWLQHRKRNEFFDSEFLWVLVDTLGGCL